MDVLSVGRVTRCTCARHAWVLLHDPTGENTVRVLVGMEIGRAIAAELAEASGAHAEAFDMLRVALAASGSSASSLTLVRDGGSLRARLNVSGCRGLAAVEVDPCNGLLAACRLKLPILVHRQAPAEDSIPEVYHPLLERLGLGSCGEPDTGGA